MRPVLVVGTGRSGTSTVARLLQDRFGIKMVRQDFLKPDQWAPKGYYEDRRMKELSRKLLSGHIDGKEFSRRAFDWMTGGDVNIKWGYKLPQTCYHPVAVIDSLDPVRIVVCLRERIACARSIRTWRRGSFKLDESGGLGTYDARMAGMLKLLHGRQVLWLDFSEQREEIDLTEIIARYLVNGTDATFPKELAAASSLSS